METWVFEAALRCVTKLVIDDIDIFKQVTGELLFSDILKNIYEKEHHSVDSSQKQSNIIALSFGKELSSITRIRTSYGQSEKVLKNKYCADAGTVLKIKAVLEISEERAIACEQYMRMTGEKISRGSIRLGDDTTLGYGECSCESIKSFRLNGLGEIVERFHLEKDDFDFPKEYTRFLIYAKDADGLLVRSGSERYSGSTRNEDNQYYIPASTFKGVFRKRASQIIKSFLGNEMLIDHMFGNYMKNKKGSVIFHDAEIENAEEFELTRNHINKFTGGVMENDIRINVIVKGNVTMVIDYISSENEEINEQVYRVLVRILNDVKEKRINFGGGFGIGLGFLDVFRVEERIVRESKKRILWQLWK